MQLQELAAQLGAELVGPHPDREIAGLATLQSATDCQVSFVVSETYLQQARASRAGALICPVSLQHELQDPLRTLLLCADPYLAYARASALFQPQLTLTGVHPSASLDPSVELGEGVHVGAHASLGPDVVIGAGASIGAGCCLEQGVKVGAGTRLYPNVVLYHDVRIGRDCIVHGGTVIGADGFGFAPSPSGWVKIHQLGSVVIGDRVEIGPNCTISRGALEDTLIGNGVIMDAQVLIAHNVEIGENTAFAGQSGVAGSARVGANCTFGGQSGVVGHLEIADNVHLQGRSVITKSIHQPGQYASLWPQLPADEWRKMVASLRQMARRQNRD